MRSSALSRLVEGVWKKPHDLRPSTQLFPDIDTARVARDLQLEEVGRTRGARGEPSSASTAMDEVEARIVERIEAEKKKAQATVEDELRTYSERLSSLDFEARFSSIRQAAPSCINAFKAEVKVGLGELFIRRDALAGVEREIDDFKRDNRLRRPARVPSTNGFIFRCVLLFAVFLIEAIANGSFLAKGSEQGLIGGFFEAGTFAFLNIVVAFFLARFGVLQINRRSIIGKILGLISIALYLIWMVGLNLGLAHYREVSGTFVDGAGALVIDRMRASPFGLADLHSWILFAIGIAFSLIAFVDGLYSTDPMPGYAAVQKRVDHQRRAYLSEMSALIAQLEEIQADYGEQLEELSRDLGVRREAHDSIVTGRNRLIRLFESHQTQLEHAGTELLSIYRDANRAARPNESGAPKRFSKPMKMERVAVTSDGTSEWNATELRVRIVAVQELLQQQGNEIHEEFNNAISQYRDLDQLMPGSERFDVETRA